VQGKENAAAAEVTVQTEFLNLLIYAQEHSINIARAPMTGHSNVSGTDDNQFLGRFSRK
jgi:hypothetical protein